LRRQTEAQEKAGIPQQIDLFADFNGLPDAARSTEFYQHDAAGRTTRLASVDSLKGVNSR
jgi:adenine-specific DNA-methyltransferase